MAALKKINHSKIKVKTISTLIKLDEENDFDLAKSINNLRIE